MKEMKMQRLFCAMAIVGFFTACSDGTSPSEGDDLSETEVQGISTELVTGAMAGMVAGLGGSGPAPAPSGPPVEFAANINHTVPCEGSGTIDLAVSLDGTVDTETGDGTLAMEVIEEINNCRVNVEGTNFTVNGNPNITMSGNIQTSGESTSGTLGYDGGFTWESDDGRSGSCTIDVDIDFSATSLSYQGQICNTTIDFTVNMT